MKSKKLLLVLASSILVLSACGHKGSGGSCGAADRTESSLPKANGIYDYSNEDNATRTAILGVLEKWAVDNKLTGITLYEDGGYVMYSELVEKGAPSYIKGYGYGTLPEGRLTGPLSGEEEAKYKMYYHTYESSDPANMIYMDDDGGVVPTLSGYATGAYWDIVMNETRTGYVWTHDLSTVDEPIAVNAGANGAATIYRVPVKTGSALKYSTLSTNSALSAYNNREVALEDYLTPYKIYYTKAYGMKRNAEAKDKNSGSLKGTDAYVAASAAGYSEEEFAKLGVKTGSSAELGDYLEFEFNAALTPFWARYYLSSSMYAPVPADFISELGGGSFKEGLKTWGKFSNNTTLSPVDTFLSTGPYVLEEWSKDLKITYKRNPNYVYGTEAATTRPSHYNIEGIYVDVITALNTDTLAALNKFLANKLHACSIPSKALEQYASDPRTTIVPGASTTKLNLNTCSKETWEELFGENGSIAQTSKDKYWDVKPIMNNSSFIDGLNYAIDRATFAAKLGATPSNDYFGSGYYSDPENGVFYNDTDAHKQAVAKSLEGTDGYGYSLELAKASFKKASQELVNCGAYKKGETVEIEMAWMVAAQQASYAEPLAKMIEDAFNSCGGPLKLSVKHYYGAVYTDVYYKKMMVGQFDIGYGGIDGNYYNPLNFMDVLRSDNSSTFTLNWGLDTNKYTELEWDGLSWTYNALWEAADHGALVVDGKLSPKYDFSLKNIETDEAGNLVLTANITEVAIQSKDENGQPVFDGEEPVYDVYSETLAFCLFATTDDVAYSDYGELYFYVDGTCDLNYNDDGDLVESTLADYWCEWKVSEEDPTLVTITISKACIDAWRAAYPAADVAVEGIDVYAYIVLGGSGAPGFWGTVAQSNGKLF